MKTIFVDGGEYVDKATYIALRDESEKLRVRALDAEARVRELEAGESFHKVAVKERDAAYRVNEALREDMRVMVQRQKLLEGREALKDKLISSLERDVKHLQDSLNRRA